MREDHVFYSSVDPAEGQSRFRLKGLDGLRAVAVSSVLIYHLWPATLPGGMIGVDIFFAISGYLITALLLREAAYKAEMNIIQFWIRRLRRLIPAIIVLVASVGTIALLIGGDIKVALGRQILGAFTFSSNWLYIAAGNDYFAQTSPELLTNFWSLAVEEQFYIFWPIVLVLVFMNVRTWRHRRWVPAGITLLSLTLCLIYLFAGAPLSRVYYGTDSHLFSIMLGVLLAFLIPWSIYPPKDARLYPMVGYGNGAFGALRAIIGWASLLLIFPLARVLGEDHPAFMPWALLASALLSVGVIQGILADVRGPIARGLRAVLSLPPLVWIGQRSYGIYLWHWPLAVIAHYLFGPQNQGWTSWLVLFLTFLIAGLSYMYVEEPIRRYGWGSALAQWGSALTGPRKKLPLAGALALVLGVVSTAFAITTAPTMTSAEQVVANGAGTGTNGQQEVVTQPKTTASETPQENGITAGTISIYGDSVTLASAQALQEKLPQASIDAAVSRTLVAELPALKEQAEAKKIGQIVVISLSTNSSITTDQIDELQQILSPNKERKVVLVTGAAPANLTWVAQSNDMLKHAAEQRKDTFILADWAQKTQGHPEYLVSDGVHPQGEGQQIYAQTVVDGVEQAKKQLKDEGKLTDEQIDNAQEEPSGTPSPATSPAW